MRGPCFPRTHSTPSRSARSLSVQPSCRPGLLPSGTKPSEPFHEQRVDFQGFWFVDQGVEQLVVASRRNTEEVVDRLFFGAGVAPPLALELDDLSLLLR